MIVERLSCRRRYCYVKQCSETSLPGFILLAMLATEPQNVAVGCGNLVEVAPTFVGVGLY